MSPGQLISLLDIMERYAIGRLLEAAMGLSSPWPDKSKMGPGTTHAFPVDNYELLQRSADFAVEELNRLDAPISLEKAKEVKDLLPQVTRRDDPTYGPMVDFDWRVAGRLRESTQDLRKFVFAEVRLKRMVLVAPRHQSMMDDPERSFGSDVLTKFESARYDIGEAARCLALGRSTAAVFHAMRAAECGLLAVCRCLGIPDPVKPSERNWGDRLREAKRVMDAKWPHGSDRMSGDGELFEKLYSFLAVIKEPWRNAAAHFGEKHTEQEAEVIFGYAADLMKRIASRMDEFGEPKA